MMLKRKSQSKSSKWSLLRAGVAGLAVALGGAVATTGCLDRPVAPAVPRTSNVYVDEIRQTAVDKIDLLFMIDNSISMADKQAILAEAVPILVGRLITPICVDVNGNPTSGNADATGRCPSPSIAEFNPIKDIHVGVITSSLGSHGATGSKDVCTSAEDNDHARLLGSIRPAASPPLRPYDGNGFLKWDTTGGKYNPAGDSDEGTFSSKFTDMVVASGENGCGFEASLEAWYRFLIDPEPPANVVVDAASGQAFVQDVDQTVLDQRKAFLRPDSLVAIIMLTDENDCSIQDEGYGWLIARAGAMFRSTSQCAANPNDKCCQSCGEEQANAGCPPIANDAACAMGKTLSHDTSGGRHSEDDLNLRCWQQKRRFGFELLYPTSRYSEGLRSPVVPQRSTGQNVQNPLFAPADGKAARDPGLVFLAGIIGVPWQDIADDASLQGEGLRYLTANELATKGRWEVILGDPNASPPVLPTDPHMIETPEDRTTNAAWPQANPITNDALVPSTSTDPTANRINGHEQKNAASSDLQYACTFPLSAPITCDQARDEANQGCDCFDRDKDFNRPLCQPPGGGPAGITQHFAKAYPGLRHLQVLKEFGENSVVASICPKVLDKNDPSYGYNPAVGAIIDRLKEALKGKCLPRPLVPAAAEQDGLQPGQVPCKVIEALLPSDGGACSCTALPNRKDASAELRSAILKKLKESQTCGTSGGTSCESFCTCELEQLRDQDLEACQTSESPPVTPGYCYINAAPNEPNVGSPSLVKDCQPDQKRLLRFVGDTPAPGAIALIACLGASLGGSATDVEMMP